MVVQIILNVPSLYLNILNEKYNCRLIEKLYRIMDEVNLDRKDCD